MKKTEEKKTIKTAANAVQFEKPYSKTGKTENKTTETETPKKEFPEIVETQKNELPKAEYETPKTEAIEELQKRLAAEIERIEGKRKIAEKKGRFH
ncbi:hypothetical protein LJC68_08935 [Bacteroidales bacterium OttesenSCG-928-B11]|nr:hypothetical protein [Bacteroidales bacterium OttesenSCG-928-B11]